MKNFVLITVGLVTGFMVGAYIYKDQNPAPPVPVVNKLKFQDLVDNEMRAFALAKDAEAKLRAADELYGKMVVLFMAELGLHAAEVPVVPATVPAGTPEVADTQDVSVPAVEAPVSEAPAPVAEAPKEVAAKEPPKETVDTSVGSLAHFSSTPYLTTLGGRAKNFTGYFAGSLTYKAGKAKGRVDSINMAFHLSEQNRKLEGETLILMTDPSGHEYARNNGGGTNRSIKAVPGRDNAFYVEASPTSYFLLNLEEFPLITGQYFDQGAAIGSVTLRKTE